MKIITPPDFTYPLIATFAPILFNPGFTLFFRAIKLYITNAGRRHLGQLMTRLLDQSDQYLQRVGVGLFCHILILHRCLQQVPSTRRQPRYHLGRCLHCFYTDGLATQQIYRLQKTVTIIPKGFLLKQLEKIQRGTAYLVSVFQLVDDC